MLFPNFMSSRVLVRNTLATIGGGVGNIYSVEIEACLEEHARGANDDGQSSPAKSLGQKEKRTRKIEKAVCRCGVSCADWLYSKRKYILEKKLLFIKPFFPTVTARFESQISWVICFYQALVLSNICDSGTWPHDLYLQLFAAQWEFSLLSYKVIGADISQEWGCSVLWVFW